MRAGLRPHSEPRPILATDSESAKCMQIFISRAKTLRNDPSLTCQRYFLVETHYPRNLMAGITVDPSGMPSLDCQQGVV
jgi:hypothetical protein